MNNSFVLEPKIRKVVVKLTNKCNLTCKHCYVSSHPNGEFGLNVDTVENIIDDCYNLFGKLLFTISGGESLIREDDTIHLLEYAKQYHKIALYTNGTLLNKKVCSRIQRLSPIIQFSIDGSNAESHNYMRGIGAFEKTIDGIRTLLDSGLPGENIQIFSTITESTVNEITEIIELAESLGIKRVRFEPVAKTGRAVQNWGEIPVAGSDRDTEKYLNYVKSNKNWNKDWNIETRQDLNFNLLKIYSDGSVLPYAFYNEADKKQGCLGNVNSSSLKEILAPSNFTGKVLSKFFRVASGPPRSLKAIQFIKNDCITKWDIL